MDKAFKSLGRRHRVVFHDPVSAYIIASRLYPGDSNAVWAAQYHIIIDNTCSKDPEFKKCLEAMVILSSRKKRRRKRKQY